MQKIMLALFASTLISGCSLFGVYRIDIPQGTPLTQAQAAQVQPGMTTQQVRYILGSPAITDTLNPNRWDYYYNFIPGTNARRAHLKAASGQHLRVYFDDQGLVTKVEGLETIPETQPGLPASHDPSLTGPAAPAPSSSEDN